MLPLAPSFDPELNNLRIEDRVDRATSIFVASQGCRGAFAYSALLLQGRDVQKGTNAFHRSFSSLCNRYCGND